MTTTDENNVRETLLRMAGVQPSQHWLQDCQTELRMTGAANCTPDAILQQLLHHDLRDVVREFPAPENDVNHPSVLLRRAVQDSMSAQHNYKSQLPASFRLLVQVEELLDVSQNAETRLSMGPASPNAPAPVGNQQARCLKLCVSDGYGPYNNTASNENNSNENGNGMIFRPENQSSVFIAMEVEPVPNLSVNSMAGVKVLMQGPLQIRHGILLWQPVYRTTDTGGTSASAQANSTTAVPQISVMGGCVVELVKLQATALQQAKLVAGVGIDPTIRALIWNPETGEMQEEDEGEQESRDLEPGAPPPLPPVQQRQPAAPPQPLNTVTPNTYANPARPPPPRPTPVSSVPRRPHQQQPSSQSTHNPYTAGAPPPLPPVQQRQPAAPPQPHLAVTPNTYANPSRPPPPRPASVPHHQQPSLASASTRNPYTATTSTASSAFASSNPYQSNAAATSSAPSNPYQSSNSSNNGSSQNSREAATGTARMLPPPRPQQQQQQSSTRFDNDIEDIVMEDSDPTSMDTSSLAARDSSSRAVAGGMPPPPAAAAAGVYTTARSVSGATNGASGGQLQAISFVELRNRLARARENEELYRQMFGQSFVVQARQLGVKLVFNIERIKSSAKESKKDKKYGYYMSARFQDSTVNGDLVTCKISNEILEPYFSLPPSKMRKVAREDRKRSEELIRNGGKRAQDALYQPRTYEATLLLSPDEFFRSASNPIPPLDKSIMILNLVKHCE